jgi:hypothetical protein
VAAILIGQPTGVAKQGLSDGDSERGDIAAVTESPPEQQDRRAILIAPTERGRRVVRLSDEIIDDIERRQSEALGNNAYDEFRQTLRAIVDSLTETPGHHSSRLTDLR